ETPRCAETAEHFVGRYVQESERIAAFHAVLARRLEQMESADDVRLHERARPVDRAIDVRLGGEVHDRVGLEISDDRTDLRVIAYAEFVNVVVGCALEGGEIADAPRVRQFVDRANRIAALDEMAYQRRSDEAGPAGYDDAHVTRASASAATVRVLEAHDVV